MKIAKTIKENAKPLGSMILGLSIAGLGAFAAFNRREKTVDEYDNHEEIVAKESEGEGDDPLKEEGEEVE